MGKGSSNGCGFREFILGPIAGLAICIPVGLIICFCWSLSTIYRAPYSTFSCYRLLYHTRRLGPCAKSVIAVLLIIPVVLGVPIASIGGALVGMGLGFVVGFQLATGAERSCSIFGDAITDYHTKSGTLADGCNGMVLEQLPPGYEVPSLSTYRPLKHCAADRISLFPDHLPKNLILSLCFLNLSSSASHAQHLLLFSASAVPTSPRPAPSLKF